MENKILIVEDDAVIAQLLYQFLTRSGYQAITTPSAEEGEEILKNEEMEHFVHRADVTMYEAKKGGGNRIAITPRVNEPSNGSINTGEALIGDLNSIPL